jgi:hypothetical protein
VIVLLSYLVSGAMLTPAVELYGKEDIVSVIRAGHRNSREAIHTLHARYQVITQAAGGGPAKAGTRLMGKTVEWWQDGVMMRWTEEIQQVGVNRTHPDALNGRPRDGQVARIKREYLVNGDTM